MKKSKSLFWKEQQEQIAPVALFKKSNWGKSDRSNLLFWHKKEGKTVKKNCKKHTKKYIFLEQIARFLRAIRSNHEQITDVALFERNHSQSLFKMSDFERKSEEQKSDSQPCAKVFYFYLRNFDILWFDMHKFDTMSHHHPERPSRSMGRSKAESLFGITGNFTQTTVLQSGQRWRESLSS